MIVSQAIVPLYLKDYKLMGRTHLQQIDGTGSSSVFTKLRSGFVFENLTLGQFKPGSTFCQNSKVQRELEGQLAWSQWLHIKSSNLSSQLGRKENNPLKYPFKVLTAYVLSIYAYIPKLSTLPMETLSFWNRSISQCDLKKK